MCASVFKQFKGSMTTQLGTTTEITVGVILYEKYITRRGSTGVDFALDWMGFPIKFTAYIDNGYVSGIKQWFQNKYQDPQIMGIAMAAARQILTNMDISILPDKDWNAIRAKNTAKEMAAASSPNEAVEILRKRAKEAAINRKE